VKILIADDDQNLLAMLVPHLEHQGHMVLLAVTGEEFLRKAVDYRVDMLISDINLPGLDGVGLYEKCRAMQAYASTPFLLWSGVDLARGAAIAAKDPLARFIKKPFSLGLLQQAVDEAQNLPPFDDAPPPGGLKL
jgi:DNA-binding NtrC family response regulator